MNDEEKQRMIERAHGLISAVCAEVTQKLLAAEDYEEAARLRDARNGLNEAVSEAVWSLPPF